MQDLLNYSEMIDGAMRGVVREALRNVAQGGLPGTHHFYITFRTDHPGVQVSDTLRARYPREMTIVLQHQFWDFKVEELQFGVTLSFGGVPEKLLVPFSALTAFADPSVKFGLQFQEPELPEAMQANAEEQVRAEIAVREAAEQQSAPGAAEIISLDAFRKK